MCPADSFVRLVSPFKYNRAEPCNTVAIVALEVTEEDVPDGDDVADASGKDKEDEYTVSVYLIRLITKLSHPCLFSRRDAEAQSFSQRDGIF